MISCLYTRNSEMENSRNITGNRRLYVFYLFQVETSTSASRAAVMGQIAPLPSVALQTNAHGCMRDGEM